MSSLLRKLRQLFRRGQFAGDLEDEMRLHVELRTRKLQQQGISPQEAHRMAQRQFGNRTSIQESSSELWGWPAIERLWQDVRHSARALAKTPAFTAIAVATLAIGLGMNTAVFSVVNAVLIRALPYPDASRLVSLWEEQNGGRGIVAPANFVDFQRAAAFSAMAGYSLTQMNLTGADTPERLNGESVTHGFFPALGVLPALGRSFLPEEDRPGAPDAVVITHGFWQRRLGLDEAVLSRSIMLDGKPYRVIGVLPPSFQSPLQMSSPDPIEFYVPAAYPDELLAQRADHEISVLGRLRSGASIAAAQAELDSISADLANRYPASNRSTRAVIGALDNDIVRRVKDSLWIILSATGLIVLITCVNVANLLLVRAGSRRRETSVRFALGAGRLRIVRQYLVESLIVAASGSAAGIVVGRILMGLLIAAAPANIPRLSEVAMDWRVFALAALLAGVSGVGFGIVPAWQASRTRPAESMKSAERGAGSVSQARWRSGLTAIEMALSLILLVGAGLLLKSFAHLMSVDLGFRTEHVLSVTLNLSPARYRTQQQRWQFFQRLEERVGALPGVRRAAFSNRMPLRQGWGSGFQLETAPDTMRSCDFQAVSPGYFETLAMQRMRGRFLTAEDGPENAPVAVVNQVFVQRFVADGDPVGKRFRRGKDMPWITITGVVNDVRKNGKLARITPQVYLSAAQTSLYSVRLADLAVYTAGDPKQLVNAIRQEVGALDRDQPLTNIKTMDEIIGASVAEKRFQTLLLTVFATVALLLAVIGIYGVLSYSVSQRTPELGIRIALGANTRDILSLVLRQAGSLIVAGVLLGLAGAFALTRYLESLLFNVQRHDAFTFAGAVALLSLVAVVASLVPARRGAKSDPLVALRYE